MNHGRHPLSEAVPSPVRSYSSCKGVSENKGATIDGGQMTVHLQPDSGAETTFDNVDIDTIHSSLDRGGRQVYSDVEIRMPIGSPLHRYLWRLGVGACLRVRTDDHTGWWFSSKLSMREQARTTLKRTRED